MGINLFGHRTHTSIAMPQEEWMRKRAKQPIQHSKGHQCVPGRSKDTPKSSTRPTEKTARENLTLLDWMVVYAYVDTLPQPIHQGEVVKYFANRREGRLLFSRATLSRKLRDCPEMEARVDSIPNALSSKQPRVVTRPDVDRALWLWVQRMHDKGELVNGAMLAVKREAFEEDFDVPEDERLRGTGWVQSFCQA